MRFKDRNLSGITTVDQLQAALDNAGINSFQYIIWKHQRPLWSPMGSFQVTPVDGGFQLDSVDRGSVLHRGTFPDQASLVRWFLDHVDPAPPQTPEQRARNMAAGARAAVEKADERARIDADLERRLAEAYGPDWDKPAATSKNDEDAPPARTAGNEIP